MTDHYIAYPSLPEYPNTTPYQRKFLGNDIHNLPSSLLHSVGLAFGFPSAHFGDLGNAINPILKHLSSTSYLTPSLGLTSKFLTESLFLPLWHALVFSTSRPQSKGRWYVSSTPRPSQLRNGN